MIKIRVMGEEQDLDWILGLLESNDSIRIVSSSPNYMMNGTTRFRRRYIEVERPEEWDQRQKKNGRGQTNEENITKK